MTQSRTTYTPAKGEEICAAIENGMSLRKAAAAAGVPHSTAARWRHEVQAFSGMYEAAAHRRLLMLEEKLFDLCEDMHAAAKDPDTGRAQVQAFKIEIEAVKWQLEKLAPVIFVKPDKEAYAAATRQDGV